MAYSEHIKAAVAVWEGVFQLQSSPWQPQPDIAPPLETSHTTLTLESFMNPFCIRAEGLKYNILRNLVVL